MKNHLLSFVSFLFVFAVITVPSGYGQPAYGQFSEQAREWNRPVKPFRIIGNIHYVGALGVSSFLITTPDGHILLDGGLPETAPQIRDNIAALGFRLTDVKFLVNSHAHFDHAGGLAQLKEWTRAQMIASTADAPLLERGGRGDFAFGDTLPYPAVKVDRQVKDGDTISLGGVALKARITPGHTRGCTNWTMTVKESGRDLAVVFVGSASIPGYSLVDNANYPEIAADYELTYRILKQLPCDVFLASHGNFFNLSEKMAKMAKASAGDANPFIDPAGYRQYVADAERNFRETLARQQKERRKP